jgi:uncharacterized membrane protein YjjP (DUF1212 family)
VISSALDVSLIIMENGGSTVRAERAFNDVLMGSKVRGVVTLWRYDFVAVTRTTDGKGETIFRPIRPPGANLLRVAEASTLAGRVASGDVDQATLAYEVHRIRDIGSPYNAWLVIFAAACAAGFFTHFIGGSWGGFGIAFLAGGIGQTVRVALQARKFGAAATTTVCAILSALIAAFGLRAGIGQMAPATLIGSVGYMIPGLPLVNGFIDVASHRNMSVGIQRILNAAFLFLILAIGIAVGQSVVEMK